MQLSGHSLHRLRDDGEFILYRAYAKQIELPSVLLLVEEGIFKIVNQRNRDPHLFAMRTDLAYDPCDVADQALSCLQLVTQLSGTPRQCLARA